MFTETLLTFIKLFHIVSKRLQSTYYIFKLQEGNSILLNFSGTSHYNRDAANMLKDEYGNA
jgi:hypothetical protein